MNRRTLLTAKDLERMPDDDSVQIELDEGELITMPPAGEEHGYWGMEIGSLLRDFVKKHDLGRVYGSDTGFRLTEDTVRSPNVAFVRRDRVAALRGPGFAKGAPDLAVEILSPSDSVRQLMRKVRQYFAAGCHTVWIVDSGRKEIEIFEAAGTDRIVRVGDRLEVPDLLPGFSVGVEDLFV